MSTQVETLNENTDLMTFEERLDGMIDAAILGSKRVKLTFNTGNGRGLQAVVRGKDLEQAFQAQTIEESHNSSFGIAGRVSVGRKLYGGQKATSQVPGSALLV